MSLDRASLPRSPSPGVTLEPQTPGASVFRSRRNGPLGLPTDTLGVPCPPATVGTFATSTAPRPHPDQWDAECRARGQQAAGSAVGLLLRGRAPDSPRPRWRAAPGPHSHRRTCQSALPTPPRKAQHQQGPCSSLVGPAASARLLGSTGGTGPSPQWGSSTFSPGPTNGLISPTQVRGTETEAEAETRM